VIDLSVTFSVVAAVAEQLEGVVGESDASLLAVAHFKPSATSKFSGVVREIWVKQERPP
jgi:hypothetical protein